MRDHVPILYGAILLLAALTLALGLTLLSMIDERDATIAELEARIERVETAEHAESAECGMCGAHISEWWFVRNSDDTKFVPVCRYCYETIIESD